MPRQLPQPSRDSINLVTLLGALADPVRLTLMREMYARGGPADCAEVAGGVEVTPPTVSHHYRVLREAGLTTTTVEGRRRVVTIRHDDLEARFPGLLAAILTPKLAEWVPSG
ncbi:ArsR/SmtB family transcription factor [Frankia sp. AgKG'84/4]|uniref:ArsR/SmtB family transcription factor n=1 Tax=Frankia sp. AgKG'84/4 TaxID=573490 RepID=UPI00200DE9AC|nr:metalloregulator ArsR/SmtB family transcription factor [Frankia sp. AgKG'84/4]MCL9795534.1 helix-turn-helix domain-containing protein [Frankia sp. AgKG'84/4]